jgi:hypothetical protein
MALKVDQLPLTPRSIWEAIKKLQRDVQELRAARTLEASAVGSGGVTVQDPARPEYLKITPHDVVGFDDGDGGLYYPPTILFYTGKPGEITPGRMAAYSAVGEHGQIPSVLLTTPDLGHGISYLKLQASNGADPAAVEILVGLDSLVMGNGVAEFNFAGGTIITLGAAGAQFASEGPIALTLNNGWTATGGTWELPWLLHTIDNSMILEGSITPGTLTAGTTIITLPPFYGPSSDLEFRVPGGSAAAYCDLVVHAGGTITITNVAGTITRVSLSQIRWSMNL